MLFKNRCYNGGKKHKLEPRYDEKPSGISIEGVSGFNPRGILFYNLYVKDICVWCGKEIKRDNT